MSPNSFIFLIFCNKLDFQKAQRVPPSTILKTLRFLSLGYYSMAPTLDLFPYFSTQSKSPFSCRIPKSETLQKFYKLADYFEGSPYSYFHILIRMKRFFETFRLVIFRTVRRSFLFQKKSIFQKGHLWFYKNVWIGKAFLVGAFYQNEPDYYSGKFFFLFSRRVFLLGKMPDYSSDFFPSDYGKLSPKGPPFIFTLSRKPTKPDVPKGSPFGFFFGTATFFRKFPPPRLFWNFATECMLINPKRPLYIFRHYAKFLKEKKSKKFKFFSKKMIALFEP